MTSSLGAYLTEEEATRVHIEFLLPPFVYAPVTRGQQLGEARLYIDGLLVSSSQLLVEEDRHTRFPQERSMIERVIDFFDYPEIFRFPDSSRDDLRYDRQTLPKLA